MRGMGAGRRAAVILLRHTGGEGKRTGATQCIGDGLKMGGVPHALRMPPDALLQGMFTPREMLFSIREKSFL